MRLIKLSKTVPAGIILERIELHQLDFEVLYNYNGGFIESEFRFPILELRQGVLTRINAFN